MMLAALGIGCFWRSQEIFKELKGAGVDL